MQIPQLRKKADELGLETKELKPKLIDWLNKHLGKLIINKINQDNSDEENSNGSHENEEDNEDANNSEDNNEDDIYEDDKKIEITSK